MSEFSFTESAPAENLAAPQGPGTNALVQNPFAFTATDAEKHLAAPQGPGTNALVQNPFAWGVK
ncbi:streptamidine-related RiPP repeat protein [Nocardia inohanensis]|uniref:streptamidine-related RiPP repeat protein n=1 Tax=Nocardia inohanensis TaxID=209246 RepID=UPI000A0668AA|nr:streptamidine-related RiPP repeat protein [Nocardia inohanensis]